MKLPGVVALAALTAVPALAQAETLRYALVVGHNQGQAGRTPLRYAEKEARELAEVLQEVGEVEASRVRVLTAPSREEVLGALSELEQLASRERAESGNDTLVFVYFSGHADGERLELGDEAVGFKELRGRLEELDATVRVGVIDACMSGAVVTRTKGGRAGPSYAVRVTDKLGSQGLALIASSGAGELASEADDIAGSYFTRAMVAGLRGAADENADLRVTLSELYAYVRDQTVRRSAESLTGPQHPAYELRLKGESQLVMSRLPEQGAWLQLGDDLSGRFVVWRAKDGHVLGEVYKESGRNVRMLVPPGEIVLAAREGRHLRGGRMAIAKGEQRDVKPSWLRDRTVALTTARGGRPVRAEARSFWATYGLSAAVVRNAVFLQQGGVAGRYDRGHLSIWARVAYGQAEVDDDGLRFDFQMAQGDVFAGYVWRLQGIDAAVGGGLGGGWFRQALDAGDSFDGVFLSPLAGVRMEVTALRPFSMMLGWDLAVNLLQVNEQIQARPVPQATLGVGYRFD